MCCYSDDPVRDAGRYDDAQEEWLESLPKCVCCGDPIQDDYAYDFGDGLTCEYCVDACRVRLD